MIEDPAKVAARMVWEIYDLRGKPLFLGVPEEVLKWVNERWPQRKIHVRVVPPGGRASIVEVINGEQSLLATAKCLNRPFGNA